MKIGGNTPNKVQFTDIKKKMILDNLEAAPGGPAPEQEVKEQNQSKKGTYCNRILMKIGVYTKNNVQV